MEITKNFKVVPGATGGWSIVDTRTARPDVGHEGNEVDWDNYKVNALLRCEDWNNANPQLKTAGNIGANKDVI